MANILPSIDSPTSIRRTRKRRLKDLATRHLIGLGGISVIIAIVLIFFYLLYVVLPLFLPGSIERVSHYPVPGEQQSRTLLLAMEEQNEIGVRFSSDGQATFFDTHTGGPISRQALAIPAETAITSFSSATPETRTVAYGLANGEMVVAKHHYKVSYTADTKRIITPEIQYPLGQESFTIDNIGEALKLLAFQDGEEQALAAAVTEDGRLILAALLKEASFLDDEISIELETTTVESAPAHITHLLVDKDQRILYVADSEGQVSTYDVSEASEPELVNRVSVVTHDQSIADIRFLAGDISLLIADSDGTISQWFPVRDENGVGVLTKIRDFQLDAKPTQEIVPEYFRKGFIAAYDSGAIGIFHTTAERTILTDKISDTPLTQVAISPRANALLAQDSDGELHFLTIHNEHPEVSWSSLWGKVWYESYEEPQYVWQSSASSNDFEPKFSLTPIAFGTLKAAFYAMLFAIPLAIFGAIYTAYFMTPKMRSTVKPTIEIMEALPTVILGFLAGLWLAPIMEAYLPAVFLMLLLLPLSVLLFAFGWQQLPEQLRNRVPDGWQALILIPVILFAGWLAFALNSPMEIFLFNGDMRSWLDHEMGIGFDQRNAMVVGIAMGFAVIPTIFSITEDAVFGVPRHLTNGSLALGATPWQTLIRVVLLTASPGIFSAVMIGFGRAVGETMIVLMATGNTPVMDWSIFQGMRTLSANISVEMPESEVHSSHYRILFLAALVLFTFTFFFNTIAEVVRQRLRKKYSSL